MIGVDVKTPLALRYPIGQFTAIGTKIAEGEVRIDIFRIERHGLLRH
jgi:hypothetical protein